MIFVWQFMADIEFTSFRTTSTMAFGNFQAIVSSGCRCCHPKLAKDEKRIRKSYHFHCLRLDNNDEDEDDDEDSQLFRNAIGVACH